MSVVSDIPGLAASGGPPGGGGRPARGGPAGREGPGPGPLGRAVPARWRSRLTLGTTPGRLRLLLIGLVAASLAWGALAGFTVSHYSSAATSVVTSSEPLTLDAQQTYHDLSDAYSVAATAFLLGGEQPVKLVNEYNSDVNAASAAVARAIELGGGSPDLTTISRDLPVYTEEMGLARANDRLGYPLGAAYLREASTLMSAVLLPAAQRLYNQDTGKLTSTSAQATGLPLVLVTFAAGLALGYAYYRTSRWLTRRTNRVLNRGLLAAGLAGAISLIWLAVAFGAADAHLQSARSGGSVPVQDLAQADIVALQARADESLTLINNSGDDQYETDWLGKARAVGPYKATKGPATGLLPTAQAASAGTPAAATVTAAVNAMTNWQLEHEKLRQTDDNGDHIGAIASALGINLHGPSSDTAGSQFSAFSADMTKAISQDQAAFAASASAGGNMYTGLEAAVIVLALAMAGGCAWGLNRRLMEYR